MHRGKIIQSLKDSRATKGPVRKHRLPRWQNLRADLPGYDFSGASFEVRCAGQTFQEVLEMLQEQRHLA